ncbi:hypothetical protein [Nitrospira sp. Nam80]
MMMERALSGKRLHIAGSIGPKTDTALAHYAHELVRQVTRGVLERGGGIVVGAGKEPQLEDGPAQVFDWSVLELIAEAVRSGTCPEPTGAGRPVVVVLSEKGETEIPDPRRGLWDELLGSGKIEVRRIMAGARSATMIRERQMEYGDALFILGGGTGVEHLADGYRKSCKAVIPLDLPLGASRDDGTGGAERLAQQSRADPLSFVRLRESEAGTEGAKLAKIATNQGKVPVNVVASGIIELITSFARPTAFYVRLLNSTHEAYERVERFFRTVVDPVVEECGLARGDLGKDRVESGFLNVEVFQRLHHSAVAIVDVTGERPNCFIELGYALARPVHVLCTAEQGTNLPFDQHAIPCHFWNDGDPVEGRREAFQAFWSQYIDRAPLVSRR